MITRYLKIILKKKKPLRFIFGIFLSLVGISRFFIIDRKGYRLRFYPTSLSLNYWYDNSQRTYDEDILRNYLKEGDFFVDIGSNVGALTLLASKLVGPKGLIYSIEPNPRIYSYLLGNLRLNNSKDNVVSLNIALGERDGFVNISNSVQDDCNSISDEGGIKIRLNKLDSILPKRIAQIDLLKIDVEGYEKFVLEGCKNSLIKIKYIYFESFETNFNKYGYKSSDLFDFLIKNGYTIHKIENGFISNKIKNNYSSTKCENLLAVRHN